MNIGKLALTALIGTLAGMLLGWIWYAIQPGESLGRSVVESAAACGALAVAFDVILSFLDAD